MESLKNATGPSPDVKIKKIQSQSARKHSSLRRNQANPQQTNPRMDKIKNQNSAAQHQQWMN